MELIETKVNLPKALATIVDFAYPLCSMLPKTFNYLTFQSFDHESTWWSGSCLSFRSTPGFLWGSCYLIFSFICMFCRSLFVLLYFFFWPLCCLFFFDIRILTTPLVSSNSSCSRNGSPQYIRYLRTYDCMKNGCYTARPLLPSKIEYEKSTLKNIAKTAIYSSIPGICLTALSQFEGS